MGRRENRVEDGYQREPLEDLGPQVNPGILYAGLVIPQGAPTPTRVIRQLGVTDMKAVSEANRTPVGTETLTQQQFAADADINTIVRRFGVVSIPALPPLDDAGVYGDFTEINDYESAMERIGRAERTFMALPAAVREKFQNDPSKFVAYAQTRSLEELRVELAEGGSTAGAGGSPAPAPAAPAPVAPVADAGGGVHGSALV